MLTPSPSILAKSLILSAGIVAIGGQLQPSYAAASPSAAAPASAPAAAAHFDVHEYRVLGNTVLANRDIETVLYPLLGDGKTLADVEVARAALEKTYHDRGFGTVFVDIPEQDVADKVIRLKVTEGRLHEVHIAGARYFSERKILAAMPEATAGTVPNLPELQQQLTAVNAQTADRTVVPVLKAGPLPGTVDLALNVTDHPSLHGSLEMDNQNTPDTKPLRSTVLLSYNNLFGDFDSLSAQYQVAPQEVSQVNVVAINYAWGALANGWHPSAYFINSNSDVPTVGTIGVLGAGQIFGSRFGYSIGDTSNSTQLITLGIDYKHFRQTIGLEGAPAVNTPISYVNLSAAYSGSWSSDFLQGSLGTAANFGPRGLPNDSSEFANKRYKGEANYFYVKIDTSLIARLPRGFQVILRADGQYAAEPLITNEDYSITGADGVRGYLEAEVLADTGIKGSIQLQSPIAQWGTLPLGNVFVFYDAGRAGALDVLSGEPSTTTLRSTGAGVTILPGKFVNGLLTWADPLLDGPDTRRGHSRILFVLRGTF